MSFHDLYAYKTRVHSFILTAELQHPNKGILLQIEIGLSCVEIFLGQ